MKSGRDACGAAAMPGGYGAAVPPHVDPSFVRVGVLVRVWVGSMPGPSGTDGGRTRGLGRPAGGAPSRPVDQAAGRIGTARPLGLSLYNK